MSDYGDFCREQRVRQQKHRAKQAAESFPHIQAMIGLGFTESPVGAGIRFSRMDHATKKLLRIDYWPSTGKWNVVGTGDYPTGPRKMIAYAKAHTTKEGKAETSKPVLVAVPKAARPTGPGNPPWDDCQCETCRSKK